MLAVASEFGTDNTWANKITFKPTREDIDFKKILITILLITNEDPITKMVYILYKLFLFLNYFYCLRFILLFVIFTEQIVINAS